MNDDGWEYREYSEGRTDGEAIARGKLAATLTRLRNSNNAKNSAYVQALDDLADAHGIKTKTTVEYVA